MKKDKLLGEIRRYAVLNKAAEEIARRHGRGCSDSKKEREFRECPRTAHSRGMAMDTGMQQTRT
jgi:hypothetical protein